MRFTSSGSPDGVSVTFRDALFSGLAPDGGLYVPEERPDLSALFSTFNDSTSFTALAAAVTSALLAPEIDPAEAQRIARRAFPFRPVLRRLDDHILLLELFHGPTCAFKDFGAQFLAAAMEHFLAGEGKRVQILVATSGDTGSAVAQAFHGKANTDVVILYPSGRVSELQEKQLTTLGGNVHALEVAGSFDDCQRLVKEAFRDRELRRRLTLTSANSINIGRLLPQAFYYIYALTRRQVLADGARGAPVVCVPSGNFGNLTAGVYAWHWGLAVDSFIAATNANDVVPQYLTSGTFRPRPSRMTLSNAMDVGNPSNFERLRRIFQGDWEAMRAVIHGDSVSDDATRKALREVFERFGVYVDPHTAVGYEAARRHLSGRGTAGAEIVVLATAHPGKFLEIVRDAVGSEPELPENLARSLSLPKRSVRIGPDFAALSGFLLDSFG